jgi:hypothetical protein
MPLSSPYLLSPLPDKSANKNFLGIGFTGFLWKIIPPLTERYQHQDGGTRAKTKYIWIHVTQMRVLPRLKINKLEALSGPLQPPRLSY